MALTGDVWANFTKGAYVATQLATLQVSTNVL